MTTGPAKLYQETAESQAGPGALSCLEFLQQHIRPEGRSWTLEGHEYLLAIVLDVARHIVIQKAAQMGGSTVMVGEMLQQCLAGLRCGYFLDTKVAMKEFVQSRFDPIIDEDELLTRSVAEEEFRPDRPKRRGKSLDNVRQKKIGKGLAYFLGVNNRGDVKSRPMDGVWLDEVAELDPKLLSFVDDRMLHSPHKLRREISQPRNPGMDINESFLRSDQKHWLHRCPKCRRWTALELEFPVCLTPPSPPGRGTRGEGQHWQIGCPKCHTPLRGAHAEWVAANPATNISGYCISQLYGPFVTPDLIAERWALAQTRPYHMESFIVSILGLPYAGDRQPVPEVLFQKRCGDWGMSIDGSGNVPRGTPYAGIDVGAELHLVIYRSGLDNLDRVIWLEAIRNSPSGWKQLRQRLLDHQVQFFVGDALPETSAMKALVLGTMHDPTRPRGAIVYTNAQSTTFGTEDADISPVPAIHTDRTQMIDDLGADMDSGIFLMPNRMLPEVQIAQRHFAKLIKDVSGTDGRLRYRRNVPNHYGFAAAHARLAKRACTAIAGPPAGHFSDLPTNPVLAPGPKHGAWDHIAGSPDHPFFRREPT